MKAALEHLLRVDRRLAPIIESCPPPELGRSFDSAFEPLARSVVYQQLSGKAAQTIYGRFVEHFGQGGSPDPAVVARADPDALRAVGLSRQKAVYIKGLAVAEVEGRMPRRQDLETMEDQAVIEALIPFKGIGRWTVEMLLIFWMERPDVLPVDDLGIRKGVMVIDDLRQLPEPREVAERGEPWRPYRSVASWYLWRAAE